MLSVIRIFSFMTIQEQRREKYKSQHKLIYINITFFWSSVSPLTIQKRQSISKKGKQTFFVNITVKFNSNMRLLSLVWRLFSFSKISPMGGKWILQNVFASETNFASIALLIKVELKSSLQKEAKMSYLLQCTFLLVDKDFSFFSSVLSN